MKNLFYSTKKSKARGFWLFNVNARNSESALRKARVEAKSYGDVVSYIKKIGNGVYSVFGGRR